MMSYLFQQVNPKYIGIDFLNELLKVTNHNHTHRDLVAGFYLNLVCEFRLWVYCDVTYQRQVLQAIFDLVQARILDPREEYGLSFFLDLLEQGYWYEPGDSTGAAVPERVSRLGAEGGSVCRPQRKELTELRAIVLAFLRDHLLPRATATDVQRLLFTLLTSRDEEHVAEVFEVVLMHLVDRPDGTLFDLFVATAFPETLTDLVNRTSERLRLQALSAIVFLLQQPQAKVSERVKRRLRFDEGVSWGLYTTLSAHPLTRLTYSALIQLAFERSTLNPVTLEALPLSGGSGPTTTTFRNNFVLLALLALLARAPLVVRIEALQDLLQVLVRVPENCHIMAKVPGWSRILLESIFTDDGADATALTAAVVAVIAQVSWVQMQTDKRGWKEVESTLVTMLLLGLGTRVAVTRLLFAKIFDFALATPDQPAPSAHLVANLAHLILTFEEFALFAVEASFELIARMQTGQHGQPIPRHPSHFSTFISEGSDSEGGLGADHRRQPSLHSGPGKDLTGGQLTATPLLRLQEADGTWAEGPLAERAVRAMIKGGIARLANFGQLDVKATTKHFRAGGPLRLALALLLPLLASPNQAALTMGAAALTTLVTSHLTPPTSTGIFSSTSKEQEAEMRRRALALLGAVHQAYVKDTTNEELAALYKLVLRRWTPAISFTRDGGEGGGEPVKVDPGLLAEGHDARAFAAFVTGADWAQVAEKQLVPALRAFTAEGEDFAVAIQRRTAKVLLQIAARYQREKADQLLGEERFAAALKLHLSPVRDMNQAISNRKAQKEGERCQVGRVWRVLYQELTQEGGPWNLGTEGALHWKLDKAENTSRMRRKLMVNYDFDDHRDASARRDREKDKNAAPQSVSDLRLTSSILGARTTEDDDDSAGSSATISISPSFVDTQGLDGEPAVTVVDRFLQEFECEQIVLAVTLKGRLQLSASHLVFVLDREALAEKDAKLLEAFDAESLRDRRWPLASICGIHQRRYLLAPSALEIFLDDKTNFFLNFGTRRARKKVLKAFSDLRRHSLVQVETGSPAELFRRSGLEKKWQKREISNFDYLMQLNTFAGRTFNDLTQYPVFPWVLADYESPQIQLSDTKIYRDLGKPIGALNPKRLEQFRERYHTFEDPSGVMKPFLYGTHYSSAASVMYYLLRLEPFTTLQ